MNLLHLDLRVQRGDNFSLKLSCELSSTGVTALYGPSGSGKTTVLSCVNGLLNPDAGSRIALAEEVWFGNGTCTPPWRRGVGTVFQDARLFPHLSVDGNLSYAERRQFRAPPYSREQVEQWLDLHALLNHFPHQLSAGQAQRVAIGRALLSGPRLLALDEPLANLDRAARQPILGALQHIARESEVPILYVSHEIEEVTRLADDLLLLRAGTLEAHGPLLELCGRLDTALSEEEQAAAVLEGEVTEHEAEFGLSTLTIDGQVLYLAADNNPEGLRRRVRIPARDVSICRSRPTDSSILNILPATLVEMAPSGGAHMLLRLRLTEQHLLARITRKSAAQLQLVPGDQVFAQVKSAALLPGDRL